MKGLVLIYLITFFGSIAALRKPVIGLLIYVGFAVLRPQFIWGFAGDFGGISLYVGIATLIGWAFNGFGSLKLGRGKSIVVALILYSVWFLISATQAVDTEMAYAEIEPLAKYVMPFLIGVTLLDEERWTRAMMWVIVLAQGYVGFEMNLVYLKGYNVAAEGFGGMDNNCFGVALVSTIGPTIALMLGAKKMWERGLAALAAALILHTTLLTFSRGAMVGLLCVGFMAFVIMPKNPKHIGALVLCGLMAIYFTGPQLAARYASTLAEENQRDASAESRIDLWKDCLRVVADKPIFGVGPGNFRVVAASLGWPPGKQAHTTWLQTAAENGIPGVTLLLLMFGIAAYKIWPMARARITDENRNEVAMASGIIMCIVGFVVAGQFVSLAGLEIPYYVTMIGVVLLKKNKKVALAPVSATLPAPNRLSTAFPAPGRIGPPAIVGPRRY